MNILEASDEEILQEAHKLRIAYGLKRTLRYSTQRDFSMHSESVAEHVFGLLFLSQYFLPLEDPEGTVDAAKVHATLLFHDFGEITHGDVSYHIKTKAHKAQEREDAKEISAYPKKASCNRKFSRHAKIL